MKDSDAAQPARWERVEALYEAACALPASERAAFLDAECVGDDVTREELESLLAVAPAAETFFNRIEDAVRTAIADQVPASADEVVGATLGRYRIEARLGAGGMGVVYRAYDVHLQRLVALKVLSAHLSADEQARQRFLIEARAIAALDHPNICAIHETGETDSGMPFLAMAYCEGETLKARIARGALPTDEVLNYATQMAHGLAAAHARGIVHRDVKPGNVIIGPEGLLKLVDFGLARVPDVTLTQPGLTPGTVAYMSPEQLRDGTIDRRADLWSLGVVLYEMLAAVRPFGGESNASIAYRVVHEEPAPLVKLRPDLPAGIHAIVNRLLQKDPGLRYPSASELLADLATIDDSDRAARWEATLPRRRSVQPAVSKLLMGAAAVFVVSAAVFLVARRLRSNAPPGPASRPALAIGILPVRAASARGNLDWLASAFEARLSSELAQVSGLTLRPTPNIAAYMSQGWPLDQIAPVADVEFFVRSTLADGGTDSVITTLELIEGGVQSVRAGTLQANLRGQRVAEALGVEAAERLRLMLGGRIHERQLEAGSTNARAAFYQRLAGPNRLLARRSVFTGDFVTARLALDSANALLVESTRLDPNWPTPRLGRAALSEVRALLILAQRGDAALVRRAFNEGIAAVDAVLSRSSDDPLALALRGRLRWQRIMLGEARPFVAGAATDSAERDLRAALALDPTYARPAADLSQLLFEAHARYSEAAIFAERAYQNDAYMQETNALIDRVAMSRFELGEDSVAAEWCAQGLRRSPNEPGHHACFLDMMAWGNGPASPDSAWAHYREFVQRMPPSNISARAYYGIAMAAVLARSPGVAPDSATAVLARTRQLVADSTAAADPLRDELPALEAGVWFRLGDSARANQLFAEASRRNSPEKAKLLATRRILRGYVSADLLPNLR